MAEIETKMQRLTKMNEDISNVKEKNTENEINRKKLQERNQ